MRTEYGTHYKLDRQCDIELYDQDGRILYLTEEDVLAMAQEIKECKDNRCGVK